MLVSRQSASEKIDYQLKPFLNDKEGTKLLVEYIDKNYHMPSGDVMDYVSGRKDVFTAPVDIMFVIADGIDHVIGKHLVEKIFTNIEKENFSKLNLSPKKAEFPITIKCCQIAQDQWIGSCDVDFLMRLCNSQLINYNANTQRVLKHVTRKGGGEVYKISINRRAVNAIAALMKRGAFISNTLTLNIPFTEAAYIYDRETLDLTIHHIKMFDILDGYHRLLALQMVYAEDKSFTMSFELRITNFDETKAKQFIWQEDQKTKMRKIDSDSMNTYDPSNRIVEMLNDDMNFIGRGEISRADGIIKSQELAKVVHYLYFKEGGTAVRPRSEEMRYIMDVEKRIRSQLNAFFEIYPEALNRQITLKELTIILYCFKKYDIADNALHHIDNGLGRVNEIKTKYDEPRKRLITEIDGIIQ